MVGAQDSVVECGTCVTSSQYKAAAISAHGTFTGIRSYAVVNFSRVEMKYVEVEYTRPGHDPLGTGDEGGSSYRSDGNSNSDLIMAPPALSKDADDAQVNGVQGGSGQYSAIAMDPSLGERAQFEAMVHITDTSVMFMAPANIFGFDSFYSAFSDNRGGLDQVIRVGLTANNPAWTSGEISPNLVESIWNAIMLHYGKGPSGCVIFYNGDVGCFQINPLAPGAVMYIGGTAKDVNGNPIASPGSEVPNGGGCGGRCGPEYT